MAGDFESIVRAIEEQDPAIGDMPIPDTYLAATLHKSDEQMFAGRASRDKDPRESLHIEQVPTPELAAGEALIAVMASSINYNTVWSSIFEPVSTFGFLDRYARTNPDATRHNRNYHVLGSDASGVVLQTGPGVHTWNPGDRVVAHCLSVELESPLGHNDTMMDPEQRIWGFETNFGGLAQLAIVKANQLLPKPEHLTWEEAACPGLVNSTAYRQLVSHNGGAMKQGDVVLIWGASGGLGSYATQYALNGGAIPVCVVSNESKAEVVRSMGADLIIDRSAEGYKFWKDEMVQLKEYCDQVGIEFMVNEHFDAIDAEFCLAEAGTVTRQGGEVVYASVETVEKLPYRVELLATGGAGHGSVPLQTNPVARLAKAVAAIADWRSQLGSLVTRLTVNGAPPLVSLFSSRRNLSKI